MYKALFGDLLFADDAAATTDTNYHPATSLGLLLPVLPNPQSQIKSQNTYVMEQDVADPPLHQHNQL